MLLTIVWIVFTSMVICRTNGMIIFAIPHIAPFAKLIYNYNINFKTVTVLSKVL